jgi:hypothetical protein
MKLSNWHVAVLVFFSTLFGTWLFGPSRVGMVGAAAPGRAASSQPPPGPSLDFVLTRGGLKDYIPLWSGRDTLDNSIIYQDASNVGVGTTTPSATLEVNGPAKFDGNVTLVSPLSTSNGGTGIDTAPTAAGQYLRASGAGTWSISAIEAADVLAGKDLFAGGFFVAPSILVPPPPSVFLPFGSPSAIAGWTLPGGPPFAYVLAGDTGLSLGILNVTASFSLAASTLTLQLLDNGSPVPETDLTVTGAASATQSGSESFFVSVSAGHTLSVGASCFPAPCYVTGGQLLLTRLQ